MKSDTKDYYERLGSETLYLWNDDAECYIKSVPGVGFFIKFKGEDEKPIAADTKTVTMAIDAREEVSKSEYDRGTRSNFSINIMESKTKNRKGETITSINIFGSCLPEIPKADSADAAKVVKLGNRRKK